MTRRILLIVGAVILAVVGTGAVYDYVKNADNRAIAGQQTVDVLIATKRIPAGTTASDVRSKGYVRTDHLPADATPQDSVATIDKAWDTQVATSDVQPGQVILRAMFGTSAPTTSGLTIPDKDIAVTVKLATDTDVAGFVQPGSQIAVFNTYILKNGHPTAKSNGGGPDDDWATTLLLPRVNVLAVSQAPPSSTKSGTVDGGTSTTGLLVTVAVSQADAERLILVAQTGMPYAALLSTNSDTAHTPGVDVQSKLSPVFASESAG